jgi:hypothetical protein
MMNDIVYFLLLKYVLRHDREKNDIVWSMYPLYWMYGLLSELLSCTQDQFVCIVQLHCG